MTCYYIKVETINSEQNLDENEFVKKVFFYATQIENVMDLPETSVMMKLAWENYKKLIYHK